MTPPLPAVPAPTASPSFSSDTGFEALQDYTEWGWYLVLYLTVSALLFSARLVPRDRTARFLTGTLVNPCLGWVNLVDREGTSAPRILSVLSSLYALFAVILNAHYLFWDEPRSPDPAIGAFLAIAGAAAVVAGCIMGTRRTWVPEYR